MEVASGKDQEHPRNDIKAIKFVMLYNPIHEKEIQI